MWILLLAAPEVILVILCYSMCKIDWRGEVFMCHPKFTDEMMQAKEDEKCSE